MEYKHPAKDVQTGRLTPPVATLAIVIARLILHTGQIGLKYTKSEETLSIIQLMKKANIDERHTFAAEEGGTLNEQEKPP